MKTQKWMLKIVLSMDLLLLVCPTFVNSAEIYSVVDVNGKKTFTVSSDNVWEMDLDRDLLLYNREDLPRTENEIKAMNDGVRKRDAESRYKLGLLHLTGSGGVSQSTAKAFELFELVDLDKSRNTRGVMYARGQGVPQSFANAGRLLSANGCKEAKFNLGYLQFWGVVAGDSLNSLKDSARDRIGHAELYLSLGYTRRIDYKNAYQWVLLSLAHDYDGIHSRQAKVLRDFLAKKLGSTRVTVEQFLSESAFQEEKGPLFGVIGPSEVTQ